MVTLGTELQADSVIFDFDGVIVDTEPLHYQAFQQILEPRGLGFSWQHYVDIYMGFDDRDAFREAFTSRGSTIDDDTMHDLVSLKATVFQEIIRSGVTAYPGVVALIQSLQAAKIPLAICSGALRSDIDPILESLTIAPCFHCIVTADDVAKSKPDPECYELAFNRLNALNGSKLSKSTSIAIEDTPAGITAAAGAGLRVIAVTNSYNRQHLTAATGIVESLEELLVDR